MNTDDVARKARRQHDALAADLLRATAYGQELDAMPDELQLWVVTDLKLRLADVMHGRAERNQAVEAEAIRLGIIPKPPGEGSVIQLVN